MTRCILHPLPLSIKGFVSEDENGENVVVLKASLSREQNILTALHEEAHIEHHDMDSVDGVGAIEAAAHGCDHN